MVDSTSYCIYKLSGDAKMSRTVCTVYMLRQRRFENPLYVERLNSHCRRNASFGWEIQRPGIVQLSLQGQSLPNMTPAYFLPFSKWWQCLQDQAWSRRSVKPPWNKYLTKSIAAEELLKRKATSSLHVHHDAFVLFFISPYVSNISIKAIYVQGYF